MHISEELVGENIQVTVHRKSSCRIELQVKASRAVVSKGKKAAIKAVNKEITIPGFRKGKAPEDLIVRKFPKEVERKLHQAIADIVFVEAQKIAKVPILNNNSTITFDLKSQTEEGAELVFNFETEPKIPSVEPKQFQPAPIQRLEVADKQIDEAIRQMMFFYAEWTPVEDRGVQEGDFIVIDLDAYEGETAQKVFHHIRFEVVAERMANWMRNLVLNARAGSVMEGMSEPDTTASEEEKNEFKPKKVKLHLLKVEQAILPELSSEFAKKVGSADVADMRQMISQILNQKAEEKVQITLREQVNDFILKSYQFDLPRSLIETEKKHRQQQMMRNPKFQKDWEAMSSDEREKMEDRLFEESDQAVRLFYLSRQIVHEAKIPITHKEVQDDATAILQAQKIQKIDVDQISKELYALALSRVILRKAQDSIILAQKA